jgi:hypothetical protein
MASNRRKAFKRASSRAGVLPLSGGRGRVVSGLVPTRALLRHRSVSRVLDHVRAVRIFFPELKGAVIRVGLTRAARGYASMDGPTIWMNPYQLRRLTVAHELVHLLQGRGLVPGGEKTADLHALARHLDLVDDLPPYLKVPTGLSRCWGSDSPALRVLLHETARAALAYGNGSRRRAIHRFESALQSRWQEERAKIRSGKRRATRQLKLFG